MQFNVHEAKSRLSELIAAAEKGHDVVIARKNKPAVRLVPVNQQSFEFGTLRHVVNTSPDFDDDLDDKELAAWEGEAGTGLAP